MKLKRRQLLMLGSFAAAPILAPRIVFGAVAAYNSQGPDIVISIYQRGAADGLNTIVPYADADYYALRPNVNIAPPGSDPQSAIDLDGFFGLHPSMSSLLPAWQAGDLAFVHASGSPSDSRSHFEAQDFMERGVPMKSTALDGWLARHLESAPQSGDSPFRAIGMGPKVQLALRGGVPTVAVPTIDGFDIVTLPSEQAAVKQAIQQLFAGSSLIDAEAQHTFAAIGDLQAANPQQYPPLNGAAYPATPFATLMRDLGQMIKANLGLEAACVDIGGWDHHNDEAPLLSLRLSELSDTLNAFYTDMGSRMSRITVVVMTEFGRRAYENASAGTDHGHGGVMMALGGNVNGGQVFGEWPGLAHSNLYAGDDLEVTTDWRTVLAELLERRLANPNVDQVFPNFSSAPYLGVFR